MVEVNELTDTKRGVSGFGSTGYGKNIKDHVDDKNPLMN